MALQLPAAERFDFGLPGHLEHGVTNLLNYFGIPYINSSDEIVKTDGTILVIGAANPVAIVASRSLTDSDLGKILVSVSASPIVLTVPENLRTGFNCAAFQAGTGAISFVAGTNVTVANSSSTFGANTTIGLINTGNGIYNVLTNVGQSPISSTVASGAAVALTTATPVNVTSISIPPGTWLIDWTADFALSAASSTSFKSAASLVSATLPTQVGGSGLSTDPLTSVPLITTLLSDTYSQRGSCTLTVAVATLLYLVAQHTFSAGTSAAYGSISARRQ